MNKVKFDPMNYWTALGRLPSVEKVVRVARNKLGRGGVVGITSYSDYRFDYIMRQKDKPTRFSLGKGMVYFPEYQVFVVHGQVVPSSQGKILALNIPSNKLIRENCSLKDTLSEIADMEGIVILDSPFLRDTSGMSKRLGAIERQVFWGEHGKSVGIELSEEDYRECMPLVDGITIYRGTAEMKKLLSRGRNDPNAKAELFYKTILQDYPHIGAVATSGGHHGRDVGTSYMIIDELPDEEKSIRESLKKSIRNANLASPSKTTSRALSGLQHSGEMIAFHYLGKAGLLRKHFPFRYKFTNPEN